MKRLLVGGAIALWMGSIVPASVHAASARGEGPIIVAGPEHLVKARDDRGANSRRGGGGSPLMTWHSGTIMTSVQAESIFWGTSWSNSSFVGDKIAGLDSFYTGFSGSNYAKTSDEYTGSNGQVGASLRYDGHAIDLSAAPGRAPSTSTVLAEVAKEIPNPVANGYYPVYSDTPRGGAGYCAWHSYGTINGVPVQFAWFFNLDGDAGCDPQDTWTTHSQGLAALGNVSGHELSEARTDPSNGGWYDSAGNENGDKCAWTFQGPVTLGGTTWKIQGEWSNNAYNTNTGYPNNSGQNGCLQGQ